MRKETLPYGLATEFLRDHAAKLVDEKPEVLSARIHQLVTENESWRTQNCVNLTPAENCISLNSRRLLDSDMATRVTEGLPGCKVYPGAPQNAHIDEIEAILISQAAEMFNARFVEWRPVSTSMANAIVFFSLLKPGDNILSQSVSAGGNYSYQPRGTPALAGLNVIGIPAANDYFEIDIDACYRLAQEHKPKLIVLGGSYALFPPRLGDVVDIANKVGSQVLFDAAHSSVLSASGLWPNPLDEGCDILTFSTQKIMGGPIGGMILTNCSDIAKRVLDLTFPAFMQTRDQNKTAAAANAICEMRAHGTAYCEQIIANAQALGQALLEEGFNPLAADRQFTRSHQVLVDLFPMDAREICKTWRQANILLSAEHLSNDEPGSPSGIRITVQEVTRRGMREPHMRQIARWMAELVFKSARMDRVVAEVTEMLHDHQKIGFSFDDV